MAKSHVFEAVVVLALITLAAALYLVISSTDPISAVRGPVYPGVAAVMLVGDDDTLYLIDSNVTAIRADGSVSWRTPLPYGWRVQSDVRLKRPSGPNTPGYWDTVYRVAADVYAGHVYLYLHKPVRIANLSDDLPLTTGIESKVVALSSGGDVEWEYMFTGTGTLHHQGANSNLYKSDDPIVVKASGDRVYVFHDHTEDVLDTDGKRLYSIGDIAGPAAVDEEGNVYVVRAARPVLHVNGTLLYPDPVALDALEKNPQNDGEDIPRLAYDPTYMVRTGMIEAYDPAGALLWNVGLDERIVGSYDDPDGPVLRSMPLYANGSLYVPVDNGTAALGTDGRLRWVRHLEGPVPFKPFAVLPVDKYGDAYETTIDIAAGLVRVYRISPAGEATEAWNYPVDASPGPAARPDGTIHMFLDSSPAWLRDLEYSEAAAEFAPDMLAAYDLRGNGTLWTFTVPREDIRTLTLNATNIADVWLDTSDSIVAVNAEPGKYLGWPADAIPLTSARTGRIIISEGQSFVYVSYFNCIYEDPVIFNRSRCAYINSLYVLDSNGSLVWEMPVEGFVQQMAPGNDTVYYILDRTVGSSTVRTAVAGAAVTALAYIFFRFFAFGTIARAHARLDRNENRNLVMRCIVDHPGATAVDVARATDMNMGTIRYHLLILTMNHRIVPHRGDDKYLRYFQNSRAYTATEKDLVALMRRRPMRQILSALVEKNQLTGPDLAKQLGISTTAVNKHIAELAEKGIVERRPGAGRGYEYAIQDDRYQSIKDMMDHL